MIVPPLKIAVLHYQPSGDPDDPVVDHIVTALKELGHTPVTVGVHDRVSDLLKSIQKAQADLVFNVCETFANDYRLEVNVAARAYVPMDDETTMIVVMLRKSARPAARAERRQRMAGAADFNYLPNTSDWYGRWRLVANRDNDYLIDRDMQRNVNFTGIGGIILQDQAMCESMEPIVDRTIEHLAPSDVAITRLRRALINAARAYAKEGTVPASAADPEAITRARGGAYFAAKGEDWLEVYRRIVDETALSPEALDAAE